MKYCPSFCILLVLLFAAISSCSVIDKVNAKQFTYTKNDKPQKLLFHLPGGKSEENFRIGEDEAKEQFYYFGDGSVFYITRNITWQTVNNFRIDTIRHSVKRSLSFFGTDKDGLFWKEVQFEEFKIGYAYVSQHRLDIFDNAVNSIKIR